MSQLVEIDSVRNKHSTIRWVDDSTIHIHWDRDVELEKEDIDEISVAFYEMTQGRMVKVVSEFGKFVNITPEAKSYAAEKSPKCIALAYVINGLAQRILIRFYIKMRRRKNPTKVFNTFDEALAWLDQC